MVQLVTEKTREKIDARQQATRSGLELVPALVRDAGQKAIESYLCFFAGLDSRHTGYVMRAATKRFFQWADETGYTLVAMRSGHVNDFFENAPWKASTTKFYFGSLKRLFAHLEADRIIERSPFIGVSTPKVTKPKMKTEDVAYETISSAFLKQWEGDASDEVMQAAMVMVAPVCIASFDAKAICTWSKLTTSKVDSIIARLYEKGIWFDDRSIRCEWLDPECEHPDFAMLMDAFVVVGKFDRDEELKYCLPKERYEELKSDSYHASTRDSDDNA